MIWAKMFPQNILYKTIRKAIFISISHYIMHQFTNMWTHILYFYLIFNQRFIMIPLIDSMHMLSSHSFYPIFFPIFSVSFLFNTHVIFFNDSMKQRLNATDWMRYFSPGSRPKWKRSGSAEWLVWSCVVTLSISSPGQKLVPCWKNMVKEIA